MRFTRTVVETVDAYRFGPVTLLSCTRPTVDRWRQALTDEPDIRIVHTDAFEALAASGRDVVSGMDDLPSLMMLTREGFEDLAANGPVSTVFGVSWDRNRYVVSNADLLEHLNGLPAADVSELVVEPDHGCHALWGVGDRALPCPFPFPFLLQLTDDNFRLKDAEPIVQTHPWVRSVTYDRGRPGWYDHVPASLDVVVQVPADVWQDWFTRCSVPGSPRPRWKWGEPERLLEEELGLRQFLRPYGEYQEPEHPGYS